MPAPFRGPIGTLMALRQQGNSFPLVVGMTGVKLGDRFVQIGCSNGAQLAAVASGVGLSGQAVAVVGDDAAAAGVQRAAAKAGVLVDTEVSSPTKLPFDDAGFDLVIIDDGDGLFGRMRPDERTATVHEVARVLRPGGRVMVIGSIARTGLAGLLSRKPSSPPFDPMAVLQADVFRTVRTLAERDGYIFYEGLKPRG